MGLFGIIEEVINNLLSVLGSYGAIVGCIFILFESIIPILPLSVFITLNFLTFGSILGFIISWIFTILGCMMSYYIFKKGLSTKLYNKFKDSDKLSNVLKTVKNVSFSNLALIIAIPFTPAFLVNIACGLAKVDTKKFLGALLLGKVVLVYFWGYIGVSLIESLKHPIILLRVGVILVIVYIISLFVSKKFKLN